MSLSHPTAHPTGYPAAETVRAVEAVADYLAKHGVPNNASASVRLAVRDAWLEVLHVAPPAPHPGKPGWDTFTIVYTDRPRGGQVFALHAPTGLVFPAAYGTDPHDASWLSELAQRLDA